MTNKSQFHFGFEERGLLESVFNEVLNGFEVAEFEKRIGMQKSEIDKILKHLRTLSNGEEVTLDLIQTRAFRNALFESIRELGIEEFQTRTGYDIGRGNATLKRLDHIVGSN